MPIIKISQTIIKCDRCGVRIARNLCQQLTINIAREIGWYVGRYKIARDIYCPICRKAENK